MKNRPAIESVFKGGLSQAFSVSCKIEIRKQQCFAASERQNKRYLFEKIYIK